MKKTLLLLHGALGSSTSFEPFRKPLLETFDVYTPVFSGHGGLPVPDAFTIGLFVEDVVKFLDLHGIQNTHILGYSMGGYVALQTAREFPDRVGRIMTLGTKFKWDPSTATTEVRMMDPEVIAQKVPQFASLLSARHAPSDWKRIVVLTAGMMSGLGDGQAMKEADFHAIRQEVMITRGAEDHMVGKEESTQTAEWLPSGTYVELPGCKHPIETVSPEILVQLCRKWFVG